jgi:hypothetical protein
VEWATNEFSAATLAAFNWRDRDTAKAWLATNAMWLHPGPGNFLEIDAEAKALGVPFDSLEFLPRTIAALNNDKTKTLATTLLARYVADGPHGDAEAWEEWWKANALYVFYSELGCYRWYVDPLAKKRGVPTKDLRGPARADKRG